MQGAYMRVVGFLGVLAVAVLAGATLLTSGAGPADVDVREIRMVVRGMTFYLDGGDAPNPDLRVKAGERVRLLLRNHDTGMTHDFVVDAWQVETKLLQGGEEAAVTFQAPAEPGTEMYFCSPHAQMMRGTIIVE